MPKLSSPDTLKAIMARQGFTLGRLAAEVGCSKPFIAHLRVGRKSGCTAELAGRISKALNSSALFLPDVPLSTGQSAKQCMASEVAA